MQVTDVRVRRIAKEGKMKVIEGEKGLFIAMPSKKSADGEYRDIAHPINTETRAMLERIILEEYEKSALQEDNFTTGTTA